MSGAALSLRPVEVLLVEDSPGDVRLTVEALKGVTRPSHLSVAKDGEEALAFLRRQGAYSDAPVPDLVLLDLNLPKRDGREVLAEIKRDPVLKRIPVVVLTTSEAEQDVLRAYDLHANCYITKPMDLDHFLETVREIHRFWFSVGRVVKSRSFAEAVEDDSAAVSRDAVLENEDALPGSKGRLPRSNGNR
jgi:two-component system, chemotaxis family, response regulator Rcp1